MAYHPPLEKQPLEERLYDFPFAQELRPGVTIQTVLAIGKAKTAGTGDLNALPLPGAVAFTGDTVQVMLGGGTAGDQYTLTVRVLTSAGETIEVDGILHVVEQPTNV